MLKKTISIPVNTMADKFGAGIVIVRASADDLNLYEEVKQPHRDDYHLFCLQEKGSASFEIDF
jgi:AraC family transcriptional activator of pobA